MRDLVRVLGIVALIAAACGGSAPATSSAAPAASSGASAAPKKPTTAAEIAMYKGTDRQQLLEDGAKAEGSLIYYSSNSTQEAIAAEFMKKYPFIKVQTLRAQDTDIRRRLSEEYQANNVQADILEVLATGMDQFQAQGILLEYWTPELAAYTDESTYSKGKNGGVYYIGDRAGYTALGYNTKLISAADAPKTYDDLLNPKWKGKMAVATSSLTVEWVGDVVDTKGADFLTKLKAQEIKAQNVSVAALLNLVISGEVPLSPTIGISNVELAIKSNAPVAWVPLEPVHTTLGSTGVLTKARHPYSAMLFMDFIHSKDGQAFSVAQGNASPRSDVATPYKTDFKKYVPGAKYGADKYEAKYNEWQALFNKTFIVSK